MNPTWDLFSFPSEFQAKFGKSSWITETMMHFMIVLCYRNPEGQVIFWGHILAVDYVKPRDKFIAVVPGKK